MNNFFFFLITGFKLNAIIEGITVKKFLPDPANPFTNYLSHSNIINKFVVSCNKYFLILTNYLILKKYLEFNIY